MVSPSPCAANRCGEHAASVATPSLVNVDMLRYLCALLTITAAQGDVVAFEITSNTDGTDADQAIKGGIVGVCAYRAACHYPTRPSPAFRATVTDACAPLTRDRAWREPSHRHQWVQRRGADHDIYWIPG